MTNEKLFSLFPGVKNLDDFYFQYRQHYFNLLKNKKWDPQNLDGCIEAIMIHLAMMSPIGMNLSDQNYRKKILWSLYDDIFISVLWLTDMPIENRVPWASKYFRQLQSIVWFSDEHQNGERAKLVMIWDYIIHDDEKDFEQWMKIVMNWIEGVTEQPNKREGWEMVGRHIHYRSVYRRSISLHPPLQRSIA